MDKEIARKSLDKKLSKLPSIQDMQRPHKGWIKAIREALGMTSMQLAARLRVSQPRITALERSEIDETVTLASLRRAAEALNCALVYNLVPKTSLQEMVMNRAKYKAAKLIGRVDHTMSLEAQSLDKPALDEDIESLAKQLIKEKGRTLWDDSE